GLGDGDRGIHARKPARDLIEAMDAMFAPLPATDAARGHRDGAMDA
ncbi:MAG: hypothetical protein JSR65_05850, partial [Proteobacteria bacterium]|nr:hypothetical protein [Pseudomonadota bacterium]